MSRNKRRGRGLRFSLRSRALRFAARRTITRCGHYDAFRHNQWDHSSDRKRGRLLFHTIMLTKDSIFERANGV